MWDSVGHYVYAGRISATEILLLRVVDSKPVEALALNTTSHGMRPLAALSSVLNKRSATESACINPDGHSLIWAYDTQAGFTDVDGSTDRLITELPPAVTPYRSGFTAFWSPNGSKWLLVQYAYGTDTHWPEALIVGSKSNTRPDKTRTDQSKWGQFYRVHGVTDDGVVIGSDHNDRVTGVHMEDNRVTLISPPMGPKGIDEINMIPSGGDKKLWILRSVSSWRNIPVLSYFSRWTERWDSQTITVCIESSHGNGKRVVGVIGLSPELMRLSGNGTLGFFRLSPDGRQIDFEWDDWLYTADLD